MTEFTRFAAVGADPPAHTPVEPSSAISTHGSRITPLTQFRSDGISRCRFHHMLVHNNGWQILRDGAKYWLKPPVSEDPLQILRPMPSKSPALAELLSSRLVV